jgi:hypothetical protein
MGTAKSRQKRQFLRRFSHAFRQKQVPFIARMECSPRHEPNANGRLAAL